MGLLNPPSGIAGKVHQKVKDYLDQVYTAINGLENQLGSAAASIKKLQPPAAPASPLASAPALLNTALQLNIANVSGLTPHAITVGVTSTIIKSGPLGTTTTVLHGNAAGDPTYGPVVLNSDTTGVLSIANGGTGLSAGVANKVWAGTTPTFITLTSSYVDNSIALTGGDINTSSQVVATHLAAALPVNQGGTGATTAAAARTSLGAAQAGGVGAHTITLAKLTGGGTNGSITWNADGVVTAFVDPT